MMLDIDEVLGELERILLKVTRLAEEGGGSAEETRTFGLGDDLRVTASLKIGFLDEMAPPATSRPSVEQEPLIDVIQTKDGLKVLVLLPGVSKEDVRVSRRGNSLLFEITSRGRSYRKEVPCGLRPSGVSIKSVVENNSVVEITFANGREARG
jgi:hypothetical protein